MKTKESYIGFTAGALYVFASLVTASGFLTPTGTTDAFTLLTLTGTVITAVCLLLRKRGALITADYALVALWSLCNLISGFITQRYTIYKSL